MRAKISEGNCLIESPATLADADFVISMLRLLQGPADVNVGFRFGTGLITADRLSAHQREAGSFREAYRWTGVLADRMWPGALPVPTEGSDFAMGRGFGRSEAYYNIPKGYYGGPDWAGLLTGPLGLNLTPSGSEESAGTRDVISAVLDREGMLSETDNKLIEGYLDTVGTRNILRRRGDPETSEPEDRALFLRIMQDQRVKLAYSAVRAMPSADLFSDAELTELARAGFDRIWRMPTDNPYAEEHSGDILNTLPAATLQPFRDELFRLAADRDRRAKSWRLVTRLAEFGDAGAERLLFLVRDSKFAWSGEDSVTQHPYLSGMIGLCRIGQAAAAQGPELTALAKQGRVFLSEGPYGRLGVATLIRLGVPEAKVRAMAGAVSRPLAAQQLDRAIAKAADGSACHF
jgi:hypothetical protein